METVQGLLGKLGRQCYAVFCLGVILVTVTIAHYVCDVDEAKVSREQSKSSRRLRALHGPPLRGAGKFY